jgi:hypothetical protein
MAHCVVLSSILGLAPSELFVATEAELGSALFVDSSALR